MWLFVWDVPSYYSLRVVSETCGSDFFAFAKFYLFTSKWPVAKLHLLAAQRERPSRSAFLLFRSGFTFEKSRTYWVLDILGMPFRMPFTILSLVLVFLVFLVQLWTGGLLHRSGRSSRRPGAGEKLLWLSLWPLWPLHLLSPMLGLFHGHCGAPREVHIGMA